MEHKEQKDDEEMVSVVVITPDGIYPGSEENDPDPEDYLRVNKDEIVNVVLSTAANKLNIKDTSDWDAYVDNKVIDPSKSFADNGLCGVVEIEWHKREGGGGA